MAIQNRFFRDVHIIRAAKRICSAARLIKMLTLVAVAVLIGLDAIGLIKRSV